MEKKRTMDRFHKLGFGKRSERSEPKPSKAEKLRELTELLRGTRSTPPQATAPPPPPPPLPPPIHAPQVPLRFKKRSRTLFDFQKSIDSDTELGLLAIDTDSVSDATQSPTNLSRTTSPTLISPISTLYKPPLRSNVSASNLDDIDCEEQKLLPDSSRSTNCLLNEDIFPKLLRPESRQIIGSYTQSTIPFRSASFSQADHMTHKYGFTAAGKRVDKATDTNRYPEKTEISLNLAENGRIADEAKAEQGIEAKEVEFSPDSSSKESNNVLKASDLKGIPETVATVTQRSSRTDTKTLDDKEAEIFDASEAKVSTLASESQTVESRTLRIKTSEIENLEIESSSKASESSLEVCKTESTSIESDSATKLRILQAAEMVLDSLAEEEACLTTLLLKEDLQKATTCVIPIPATGVLVNEWSTTSPSEEWIQNQPESLDPKTESSSSADLKQDSVKSDKRDSKMQTNSSIEETESLIEDDLTNQQLNIIEASELPDSVSLRKVDAAEPSSQLEVRKRHSNNDVDSAAILSVNSSEEKRRIDKSRRRKGIYIQWPVLDRANDIDSPDTSVGVDTIKEWQNDMVSDHFESTTDQLNLSFGTNRDLSKLSMSSDLSVDDLMNKTRLEERLSVCSGELTPLDNIHRPSFPSSQSAGALLTQASDDRDDASSASSPPKRNLHSLFIRSDSVFDSDTEKNYAHDRSSTSPAPVDGDLKRYSKRPLRGPYGQMLEAEMKKLSPKVQYEELLNDFTKTES